MLFSPPWSGSVYFLCCFFPHPGCLLPGVHQHSLQVMKMNFGQELNVILVGTDGRCYILFLAANRCFIPVCSSQ